jgi:hypothetical protein
MNVTPLRKRATLVALPGQIQSPLGNLALTSTRPYKNEKLLIVRILADWMGKAMSSPAYLKEKTHT